MKKIILAVSAATIALSSSAAFAQYNFQARNANEEPIYAQAAPMTKVTNHRMKAHHVGKQTPADKRTSNTQNPKL
jgi:hypothetical protein